MAEATVTTVSAAHPPGGGMGRKHLAAIKAMPMRPRKGAPSDIGPPSRVRGRDGR